MDGPGDRLPASRGPRRHLEPELVRRVGEAVSREARAMRAKDDRVGLNVWAPTVNLLRHPLWGRNEEGYAEDPYLTSAVAVAYTRGLRGDHPVHWRTAPILKHWLAHNNETDRDVSSASVRPRVLHEYDLRAFRGAVEAGAVAGVMPAYNLVNGRPNHLSPGCASTCGRGPTVSCWSAPTRGRRPTWWTRRSTSPPTRRRRRRRCVRGGLLHRPRHRRIGDGSPAARGAGAGADRPGGHRPGGAPAAHRAFRARRVRRRPARGRHRVRHPGPPGPGTEAAEQAVVLLRNEPRAEGPRGRAPLLPLAAGTRLAVVGLLADECKLDWYSGSLLHRSSPLDGLRERFGAVEYAEGTDLVRLRTASGACCWHPRATPPTGRAARRSRWTPPCWPAAPTCRR
ncbi:glycoside hydrolase family 3 N-terminal domain-containing protein [Streptomyces zhihengii]